MNADQEHRDECRRRGMPYGLFLDGGSGSLIGTVTGPWDQDGIGQILAEHGSDGLGVALLILCWRHPDTAAVDCTVCVPVEEGI